METAIKLNYNFSPHSTSTLSKIDDKVLSNVILYNHISEKTKIIANAQEKIIKNSIDGNNTPGHITLSEVIEYNNQNSYVERKVIDMNAQIQSEIDKILRTQRNIYIFLFIISILMIITSWISGIFPEDISIVLKPLSIAFSLMIALHYGLGRAR